MKKPDISEENIWTFKSVKRCQKLFQENPEQITKTHLRKLGTYVDIKKGYLDKSTTDKKHLYYAKDLREEIFQYLKERKQASA